jgi:Ca-activated chloride channel family protein
MRSKEYLMSRIFGSIFMAFAVLCLSGPFLFSQAQPAGPTQAQPKVPSTAHDPTRPEIQPSLDVDRDPVPSPDAEDNLSVNPSAPATKEQSGTLQKQRDGSYTMHTEVDEVLLSCTVIDDKGKSVTDLDRKSFRVWEDGVPQTTSSFQHQDLPVSIGILVDNSGSMRDKRQAVKTAALNLLRASNSQDSEFVVNFSERAFLDQGFTSDMNAVDRGLSHFDSSGTTALYDAVAASADELSHHAKQPKQVLLIITDGADNASRLSLEQAIRRVQNLGGPVVYTIGLLYDTEKREGLRARNALATLSEETGGIAYFPASLGDVDEIASEVARDIRNQYTVGYRSTKPANLGGFRSVHVEATAPGRQKLIVRTRRGYYAKPQQPTQTAQEAKP